MENNKKMYVLYSWDEEGDITIKGVFDESRLKEMEELCESKTGMNYDEFTLNNIDLVPMYHGEVVVYCRGGHPVVIETLRVTAVSKDTPECEKRYQIDGYDRRKVEGFISVMTFEVREEIGDDMDKARLHPAYSQAREFFDALTLDESAKPLQPILSLSLPLHKNVTMGGKK